MVKIFQRVETSSHEDGQSSDDPIWFELSKEYRDLRGLFLTKRYFTFSELWIVHDYYGGEGNFYSISESDYSRDAFRIVRDLDTPNYKIGRKDLEEYIDSIEVSEEYMIKEFKFFNDTFRDPNDALHTEWYQEDLDDRIREYVKANNIESDLL